MSRCQICNGRYWPWNVWHIRPRSEHTSILISLNPFTEKRVKFVCATCLARDAGLRLKDKAQRTPLSSAELAPEWRAWLKQAPLFPSKIRSYISLADDTLSYDSIRRTYSTVEGKPPILQLMTIDKAFELFFKRGESFGLGKFGGAPDTAKGTYETVLWKVRDQYDDFHYCVTGSIYTLRDRRIAIVWKVLWHGSDG